MTTSRAGDLRSAASAAVMHCLVTQQPEGHWNNSPADVITETALACIALLGHSDKASRQAVTLARMWLSTKTLKPAEGLQGQVEKALWTLATDDTSPIEFALNGSVIDGQPEASWLRLTMAIALYRDRPARHGLPVTVLRAALQKAMSDRPTPEDITAYVLTEAPTPHDKAARRATDRLASVFAERADTPTDALTASLCLLAHAAVDRWGSATRRHCSLLHRTQRGNGTWCSSFADIRGTALTLRALRDYPGFAALALPQAVSFLRITQNKDGGWPARPGTRSDSGTTALVLHAVAGLGLPAEVVLAALAFLGSNRTTDGLWTARAGVGGDEAVCTETVAHVVAAMRHYPKALAPSVVSARHWLAEEVRGVHNGDRLVSRYGLPRAVFSASEALGWKEPVGQDVTRRLIKLQNADGGWPSGYGGTSTAAATGLALAALGNGGLLDTSLAKPGTDFLLLNRRGDGSWPADSRTSGGCSALTHAFGLMGLHSAWQLTTRSRGSHPGQRTELAPL